MRKAILVVDIQNDFIDTEVLGTPEAIEAAQGAYSYLSENVKQGDVLYVTLDTHYEDYLETQEGINLPVVHCQKGSKGWESYYTIKAAMNLAESEMAEIKIMEKAAFGAVNAVNDLETQHTLKPFEEIVLMGICTDICVITTAALLKSSPMLRNVPVKVVENACAGITPELHKQALDVMKSFQVEVI